MDKTLVAGVLATASHLFQGPQNKRMESLKSIQSILGKALPKFFRLLFIALFLVNIRSWPITWHCKSFRIRTFFSCYSDAYFWPVKVWRPVWKLRLQFFVLRLRCLFMSRRKTLECKEKWFEDLSPVGANPFERVTVYKTWASECSHFLFNPPYLYDYLSPHVPCHHLPISRERVLLMAGDPPRFR